MPRECLLERFVVYQVENWLVLTQRCSEVFWSTCCEIGWKGAEYDDGFAGGDRAAGHERDV